MKKLLFVLRYQPDAGNEWKAGEDGPDLEPVRQQLRAQLEQEVPVVILPRDVVLFVIELEEAPAREKEAAPKEG